jgi:hypothetical protein
MMKPGRPVSILRRALRSLSVSGFLVALASVGCGFFGASEEEVRKEFEAFVRQSSSCQDVSECVVAAAGCPLGCFAVVRHDRKAAVEAKARELIESYERGGRACAYGCIPVGELACTNNRCEALPWSPSGGDAGTAADGVRSAAFSEEGR